MSDKVLNLVADQLKDFASQWDGHQWYAPLTALVQSSGWGKSRLICQMWRMGFYVVYISCMKESQSGFPRRTGELADIMQGPKSTESTFVALVVSILAVLNQHPGMACEEWMAAQEKDDAIQHEILAVFQTMKKSIGVITDKPYIAAEEDHKKFCQVEIDKLKQRGARVLLCVDEAGELGDNFLKFRRSLRSMPSGDSFFGIVLGTDRIVADLAAAQEDDPSARARLATHFNVFHPIYLIGKSDIFAQVGAGSSDITNPCNAIRYGRPLWAAYYDSVGVIDKLDATLQLAMKKLLGKDINIAETGWVNQDIAIAVFACIVGLDVVAWGALPQELVARHMRTIVCISKDRRRVYTSAAAEPALAAAAAMLLHAKNDAFLAMFIDKLTEVCKDGLVLEGIRGEIVARIVIILAMHECTKSDNYIKSVPLATFLETMFGGKVVQDLKDNCVNLESTLFFNCFIPTSLPPSPQLLDDYFVRCAALVARRKEHVLDFAVPARGGLLDVGASAALSARSVLPRAAKKKKVNLQPLHHRISFLGQVKNQRDERLDHPLELLFQIGDRGEGERVKVEHTTVIVKGLEGFQHLKSERMKAANILEKLRILSRTCEDVFKDASDKEKDVLRELIPLGFDSQRCHASGI
ncbi:hypothetical protein GOP47_0015123 [Adiantum capillus-veneris]|uniref:Uncharacterized protein n=1 Tax=Adiantum capillus-veneris TaxID=13818 RepID=A0A9D4ZEW8_ADICA|nr:hypothetical protein GOP47_0015123 [Adiantum capillus-veneris]